MLKRFLLTLIILAILPACGRKGDIIIPGTILPQAASNLGVEEKEGRVLLAWDEPERNTADRPLTNLAGFIIMRAEAPEDGKGCPCNFEKAGYIDLELPKGAVVIKGKRVVWQDETSSLIFGKEYIYKVEAVNKDGFPGLESGTVKIRPLLPPEAPKGLAVKEGNHSASLAWQKVEKDTGGTGLSDPAGYNVYRSKDEKEWLTPVNPAPVTEESYTDAGLINNERYFYRITALRGHEAPYSEGGYSAAVSAVPNDREAPAPPTGLRAVPGEGVIMLSWDVNPEPDIAGYKVFRQAEGEEGFRLLTEAPVTTITFRDTEVASGKAYTYYITAVDNAVPPNESAPSERAGIVMP